ncbi:MAG: acyl carrier protein [Prevotella sp.]|nr:acyl carrier protein [uncultured Prevotella sp.]MDY4431469.1 acyl carrier protein [Prevotella sp.]
MEKKELMDKLTEIFREVMDNDEIVLNDETTSEDIEEWDSLSHIELIDVIGKELGVKITSMEFRGWENVGEMVESLLQKLN